jgi:hypothetical protein
MQKATLFPKRVIPVQFWMGVPAPNPSLAGIASAESFLTRRFFTFKFQIRTGPVFYLPAPKNAATPEFFCRQLVELNGFI